MAGNPLWRRFQEHQTNRQKQQVMHKKQQVIHTKLDKIYNQHIGNNIFPLSDAGYEVHPAGLEELEQISGFKKTRDP